MLSCHCNTKKKMAKKRRVDRLSDLPDSLLCSHILSRLSLRDAIASSILSRRWQFLWTQIPCLHFFQDFYDYMPTIPFPWDVEYTELTNEIAISAKYIEDVIHNILSLHSAHLESFRFDLCLPSGQVNFDQWIKSAALKGVKQMHLSISYDESDLPPSVFACHLLTGLKLSGFMFTDIPTDFGGFLLLKECSLFGNDNLTDERLEQLIALCPLLQKLVLINCPELINLKICSSNLSRLALRDSHAVSLTADCPQLAELKVEDCHRLFELELNSCVFLQHMHTTKVLSFGKQGTVKSLKKLSLDFDTDPPFLTFLGSLPELEELDAAAIFIQNMAVDQMGPGQELTAGKVVSDSTFPNLKKVHLYIASGMRDKVVALLHFLLKIAPSLKTVTLGMSHCPEDINDNQFKNQLLDLKPAFADVELRVLDPESMEVYYEKEFATW